MSKKVPLNVYSIEDIDSWRDDFFYPVSMDVGETINSGICLFLFEEYHHFKENLKVYYRIASKQLYLATFDVLMKLVLAHSMRSLDEYDFVLTNHRCPVDITLPDTCKVYDLYRGTDNIDFFDLNIENHFTPYENIPWWKKVGQLLKDRITRKHFTKKDGSRPFLMIPNQYTLKHLELYCSEPPCWIRPEMIFRLNIRTDHAMGEISEFKDFSAALSSYADSLFKDITGSMIPKRLLAKFEKEVAEYFERIALDFIRAHEYCRNLPANVKLYTGTAKYFVRLIGESVRESGGTVTGFDHGYGWLGMDMPQVSFVEFATCDRYVCLNKREADEYRRYPMINNIDFPVVSDLAESILEISNAENRIGPRIDLDEVITIMYLNYNYHYDHHPFGLRDYVLGFDLQLKIIEFLLTLNKRIIFKNRPKSALFSHDFNHFGYFGNQVEYSTTPFSMILDQADVFILEGAGSGALYEAMSLTTKPVILLKAKIPSCRSEFEAELKKRCFVVDLIEDHRNRLWFDKAWLKSIFGL